MAAARTVPKGPEGDHHLDGPAAVKSADSCVPHGVPTDDGPLVNVCLIDHAADRVHRKREPVSPVEEGVEGNLEMVVLEQGRRVTAELVRHHAVDLTVPAARCKVDVLVIEEDP